MLAWALSLSIAVAGQVAKSGEGKIRFDTLKDADLVPLPLRNEIRDALPISLVGEGHAAKVVGNELRIDSKGTGSLDASVTRAFQVLRVKTSVRDIDVAVFRLSGAWFAAPARVGRARMGRHTFELLDVDSNGTLSTGDFVRIDDGRLRRFAVSMDSRHSRSTRRCPAAASCTPNTSITTTMTTRSRGTESGAMVRSRTPRGTRRRETRQVRPARPRATRIRPASLASSSAR